MLDNLYITSKNYIYNQKTGRLFKVSNDVKKVLDEYNCEKNCRKIILQFIKKYCLH